MKSIAFAMVCIMAAHAGDAGSGRIELDSYKWKNRLILVFAPAPGAPPFQEFKKEANSRAHEVLDRDIVLFHVLPDEVRSGRTTFNRSAALALREKYGVQPDVFAVILIGKDGSEKLRQHDSADLEEIFSRIDSMPMRQMEMRRKSKGNKP